MQPRNAFDKEEIYWWMLLVFVSHDFLSSRPNSRVPAKIRLTTATLAVAFAAVANAALPSPSNDSSDGKGQDTTTASVDNQRNWTFASAQTHNATYSEPWRHSAFKPASSDYHEDICCLRTGYHWISDGHDHRNHFKLSYWNGETTAEPKIGGAFPGRASTTLGNTGGYQSFVSDTATAMPPGITQTRAIGGSLYTSTILITVTTESAQTVTQSGPSTQDINIITITKTYIYTSLTTGSIPTTAPDVSTLSPAIQSSISSYSPSAPEAMALQPRLSSVLPSSLASSSSIETTSSTYSSSISVTNSTRTSSSGITLTPLLPSSQSTSTSSLNYSFYVSGNDTSSSSSVPTTTAVAASAAPISSDSCITNIVPSISFSINSMNITTSTVPSPTSFTSNSSSVTQVDPLFRRRLSRSSSSIFWSPLSSAASTTAAQPIYANTTSAGFLTASTTSSPPTVSSLSSLSALNTTAPTTPSSTTSIQPAWRIAHSQDHRHLRLYQLLQLFVAKPLRVLQFRNHQVGSICLLQVGPDDAPYDLSQSEFLASISFPNGLECHKNLVILFPGTAVPALDTYTSTYIPVFRDETMANADVMVVSNPSVSLENAQTTTEYVALAINYAAPVLGRRATILAWPQGNLNVQWALKYWRSTRTNLKNYVGMSPDYDGTIEADFLCVPSKLLTQDIGALLEQLLFKAESLTTSLPSSSHAVPPQQQAYEARTIEAEIKGRAATGIIKRQGTDGNPSALVQLIAGLAGPISEVLSSLVSQPGSVLEDVFNFATTLATDYGNVAGNSAFVPTTTVFSLTDEVVKPQGATGFENASGYLLNASNIYIQGNGGCPVAPAVLVDRLPTVITHKGVLYSGMGVAVAVEAVKGGGGEVTPDMIDLNVRCTLLSPLLTVQQAVAQEAMIPGALIRVIFGGGDETTASFVAAEPAIKPYATVAY
ncbi:uncharacterized protein PAC_16029 [Phialocephala subalpina]|uniref:Uncharacterized protein n=1 Tax=Phialocephala subalpina TaxID=576137 RepID=A0A1L7XM89_9HELO|nr:uncharacterized protein PAC_16029 [Phialocephala subalpina]